MPFPGYGDLPGFELTNSNKLLQHYPGAIGGKAGFTDAARHTLVGAAERDGRRLVVALMRGEQEPVPMWRQAAALLDWGFAQPPDAAPVGVLVDAAPAPPTSPVRRGRAGGSGRRRRRGGLQWAAAGAAHGDRADGRGRRRVPAPPVLAVR